MNGDKFVRVLMQKLGLDSQRALAITLQKGHTQVSHWAKGSMTETTAAGLIAQLVEQRLTAEKLLPLLEADLGLETHSELANALGMSRVQLYKWKQRHSGLTPQQISNAITKARSTATLAAKRSTIRPIAEFVRIEKAGTRTKFQILPSGAKATKYFRGLKEELVEKQGVYLFYDSRGHALYAGQTSKQGLWKEMNLAFNRARDTQSIKLVRHPKLNFEFRSSDEQDRQIKATDLKLHELAHYFSAFEVESEMIDDVEALLVRAFPNDLLNSKMERFAAAKDRRAKAAKRRSASKPNK